MIRSIVKRDGRRVAFNADKITQAIRKALTSVHPDDGMTADDEAQARELTAEVLARLESDPANVPTVEHCQDLIERILIAHDLASEAKNFILYRQKRTNVRNQNASLTRIYRDLTSKTTAEMDLKRENANIDANAPMGLMLRFGSEGAKDYVKRYVLRPEHAQAHDNGDIHIHDLDFYLLTINCCQIPLKTLFKRGFSTGHGFLREPRSILTAAALTCIVIQSNQNDMHGGQSIPMFEYDLAPYVVYSYIKHLKNAVRVVLEQDELPEGEGLGNRVLEVYAEEGSALSDAAQGKIAEALRGILHGRFDDGTREYKLGYMLAEARRQVERETYQAMEALIHNLNSMQSRAGAQVPFSSINYGTGTTPEQRLIIKSVLDATDAGLGGGETPIFPVQIFKVLKGCNTRQGEPNYDLFHRACEVSAKRLFPNFSFLDQPYNMQYYKPGHPETELAVMGCRTRVFGNHYDPEHEIITGRGNLSFTTINLPRLGIAAHGSIPAFYQSLDEIFALVCQQLLDRFEIIAQKRVYNYPFLMGEGIWLGSDDLEPDDQIREIIKHGSLSVGFIGLAECLKALIGHHHAETPEAERLGFEIISHMRDMCDWKAEETGLNFSLFSTPAEGLAGRFVAIDRRIFGTIPGVTDRDYYTNSFHVPVYYEVTAAEKIKIEGPYHALCNAGAISYVELDGDLTRNVAAFEKIILYMRDCGVNYGSINHPVDRCPCCGYVGIINDVCPKCGRRDGEGVTIEHLHNLGVECIRG